MTIAVAKGILANPENPIEHIGKEFMEWYGTKPKDVGNIIRQIFHHYKGDWFEAAKITHLEFGGKSAGNGSLNYILVFLTPPLSYECRSFGGLNERFR